GSREASTAVGVEDRHTPGKRVDRARVERRCFGTIVEPIGSRDRERGPADGVSRSKRDELLAVRKRKGSKQHALDEREHGGGRTNAERQRPDGERREAWGESDAAKRERNIAHPRPEDVSLMQRRIPPTRLGAQPLAGRLEIPEPPPRLGARLVRR